MKIETLAIHAAADPDPLVLRRRDQLYDKLFHARMVLGAVCSPFNSWLVLRGLRTLPCRMVESLIEHRASAEQPASNSPENLLRLSVGLENSDDLIADLLQALAHEP